MFKKILFCLLSFLCLYSTVNAEELVKYAKSAILIEPTTNKIVYENNSREQMAPASMTKMMTMLLIMEAYDNGQFKLDDMVPISKNSSSMGGSQLFLQENTEIKAEELIKGIAIASGNDAAVAMAEFIAGTTDEFVKMMNDKCAELGMNSTVFKNCSGLDAEGHYSTARDIAIMSKELLKHDKIVEYSTIWMDTLRNGATQLVNTNKLVRFYDGATGLKTGTTNGAGCCVSASAKRNGLHLIAVVMGASTSDDRFRSAKKLLDSGFANYEFKEMKFELKNKTVDVTKGTKTNIELEEPKNISFLLEKGQEKNIETYFNLPQSIKAPINKGDTVGRVTVKLNGEIVATTDIVAAEDVDEMNFVNAMLRMLQHTFMA